MHSCIGQNIKSPLCPSVQHFISYLPFTFPFPSPSPSPTPSPFLSRPLYLPLFIILSLPFPLSHFTFFSFSFSHFPFNALNPGGLSTVPLLLCYIVNSASYYQRARQRKVTYSYLAQNFVLDTTKVCQEYVGFDLPSVMVEKRIRPVSCFGKLWERLLLANVS